MNEITSNFSMSPSTIASVLQSTSKLSMKALVKDGNSLSVQKIAKPKLIDGQSVIVRVTMAGLCRTDLYAAEGKIKIPDPMVLGHELSGVVEAIGSDVENIKVGQRVTVNPLLPCNCCLYCSKGNKDCCQKSRFLGIDLFGCFAEFVCVPASSIYPLPDQVSDIAAAYAEPIAASLAVMKAGLNPGERGLIYGKNRFSQLLEQILRLQNISNISVYDQNNPKQKLEDCAFDYIIETLVDTKSLKEMVQALRPGGKIILKSRQYEPIEFKMTELLKKEPVFHVVHYGSFEEAMNMLASGQLNVENLVDGIYKLEDFPKAIAAAQGQESLKPFFAPWAE